MLNVEMIRELLGEKAANRVSEALQPKLDAETIERALRYVSDVPGDRITRLKDRAAFAAAMSQLIRTNPSVRRTTLKALADRDHGRQSRKGPRTKSLRRARRKAAA